jgi:hypothetical protein
MGKMASTNIHEDYDQHRRQVHYVQSWAKRIWNQGDSWLLVVGSPIGNLTPGPSFGHSLFLNTQMGHVSPFETFRFQKLFNDIRNLWIQWILTPSIVLWRFGSPIPKVGAYLGVWGFIPSRFSTLSRVWNVTPMLHFWSTPL